MNLEALLATIPKVREALARIPDAGPQLKRALGRGIPVWNPRDDADITNKVYMAALQEEIERLGEALDALTGQFDDTAAKAEIVRAAELKWEAKALLPDALVFGNAIGEVASLPLGFVRVYAARHQLDVTSIETIGSRVIVKDGQRVVATMPKTLWVCLDSVLDQCKWFRGNGHAR